MRTTPSVQRVAGRPLSVSTVLDVYGPVQAFASCRFVQPDGQRGPCLRGLLDCRRGRRVKAGEGPSELARNGASRRRPTTTFC